LAVVVAAAAVPVLVLAPVQAVPAAVVVPALVVAVAIAAKTDPGAMTAAVTVSRAPSVRLRPRPCRKLP
jgi:hypothetical protein